MDILLIRHGTAAASWEEDLDPGLSLEGSDEAEILAKKLTKEVTREYRLISSPLARARETAAPIAKQLNRQVVLESALAEISTPVILKKRKLWLRNLMKEKWKEQGTTIRSWRANAFKCVSELQHPSILFTHFLLINSIVCEIKKHEGTVYFWPATCSVTHIKLTGDGLKLITLGEEMKSNVG